MTISSSEQIQSSKRQTSRNSLTKKTEVDVQFLSNEKQCRRKTSTWRAALGKGHTTEAWSKESKHVTVQNQKLAGEEEDGVNVS